MTDILSINEQSLPIKNVPTPSDYSRIVDAVDGKSKLAPLAAVASAAGAVWGGITGNINDQGDLINKFSTKANTSHSHIQSDITGLATTLDLKAPLSNPAFTGTPTAATASDGTKTTQLATTEFVDSVRTKSIQNSQSADYTLVISDAGKTLLHPSADTSARTFTIPSNASVPFPIGSILTFVNQNAGGVVTIAITSDTMRLAGAGTTGSRTLAANGVATVIKLTSTEWIISGVGLT